MKRALCFDDVLIEPRYSTVDSRADVEVTSDGIFPIVSSNMTTVTGPRMARSIALSGGVGCLHRFGTIEQAVFDYQQSPMKTWVSIGLGEEDRLVALRAEGARTFVLDVAHAANKKVAEFFRWIKYTYPDTQLVVGNFATFNEFMDWMSETCCVPDWIKVGVGGGSACRTREVTGCGLPTLDSLLTFQGIPSMPKIIADGGIRNSGDFCKAMAAGAAMVMLGRVLAATPESPGEMEGGTKYYSGSASQESYEAQGKVATHRTPEGATFGVYVSGTVDGIFQEYSAALRSAMSYVGAHNIQEFHERAIFNEITWAGHVENGPHGRVRS